MDGTAQPSDIDLISNVARNMTGVTLCALGDFAANPVIHTVKNFPEDFQKHMGTAAAD
jgi:NADH-quinone oxidoreductase subunit F